MKFEILNRWTAEVQFTAEIDCQDDAPDSVKRGLAVKWAVANGVDLGAAHLSDAALWAADLRGAGLRAADLSRAGLCGADLRRADLGAADLSDAVLRAADLRAANLRSTNLSRADLRAANLRYADLILADLSGTDLWGADLCNVVGNMREIKSAQIDTWAVVWTRRPDGETVIHIGCEKRLASDWVDFSDHEIDVMDPAALYWWWANKDFVLGMVERFPAVPFGGRAS